MISGANEESLIIATARANIILKLNNTNEYKSWIILDNYIDKLEQENKQLKEQLQQKEDIINKAKEYIEPKLNMKNKDGVSFLLFKRSHVEKILEILDNKGE